MPPYKELPSPPEKISSGAILARMIDGIGFRYQVATDGLTDNEVNFLPTDGSMNMIELLEHIYKVLFWGYRACDDQLEYRKDLATYDDYRNETLEICQAFKKKLLTMSDEDLNQISIFLKRKNKTFTFWYLIKGFSSKNKKSRSDKICALKFNEISFQTKIRKVEVIRIVC